MPGDTAFYNPLRLVMMGTGTFALPTFLSLYDSPHEVVGLFTQPDRKGRGHHNHPHPMREAAEAHGTPVFQPDNVNTPESLADLRNLNADLCVVAAYGQILSAELLQTPKFGAINLHASLLPKYRGAAPIQYAILNGETSTGVTIFQIEPKLDAGPILGVDAIKIGSREKYGAVQERLAALAVPLTSRVLGMFAREEVIGQPQDSTGVTKAPKLRKEHAAIPWEKPAAAVANHLRAMQPWPNPFTFLNQPNKKPLRLIVMQARQAMNVERSHEAPGTVLKCDRGRFLVQTGDGVLDILEVKPEGKRAMPAAAFLNGHQIQPGDRLSSQRS
ncbi:methionyl-tRNA formyltransferase [Thalassoroseus pseudoceratinae]|uniref:methionyl-tRNA formyltransferase n=1 Tax=Thalassoroseus pseudoceratinae TaxID=2713176 RepID=UPI00141EAEB1|nr:methionyl-tRNA formyltransferase [Thalassoroseus pseudoceratinae]